MVDKKNIGLIFCRGGSKGIPGKNIKEFHGKPLLYWISKAAFASDVFDEIYLSTDDERIAKVGANIGLKVPFLRPWELATDSSDQFLSHDHIIKRLDLDNINHRVCVINNNPFINKEIIYQSYKEYINNDEKRIVVDAVKIEADYLYFRQMDLIERRLKIKFRQEYLNSKINRQSNTHLYAPINNLRWGKPSWLISYENYKNTVAKMGHGFVILPKIRNFDLDDNEDWLLAEKAFNLI